MRAAQKFIKAGYKAGQVCGIRDWKKESQEIVEKVGSFVGAGHDRRVDPAQAIVVLIGPRS